MKKGTSTRITSGGWRRRSLISVASTLVLATGVTPAWGDDSADTATARALGTEGVTLANAGKCKEALEKLERAEKLHHAPTTATRLAECEIDMGRLVRGTERLQRVVRERVPVNAHPAFALAIARAHKLLEANVSRIATLRVTAVVPQGTKPFVTLDDEATSEALLDTDRAMDPGIHSVKVTADGYFSRTVSVSLDDGQAQSIVVELTRDPKARPKETDGPSDLTASLLAGEKGRSRAPAWVAFAVGAVGLGLGVSGAVVVDGKVSSLSRSCDANRACPPEREGDLRDAKTWASVSTAGFVAAGLGGAAGVVLLLLGGKTTESVKSGFRVKPTVGARTVGVDGTF